MATFNIASSSSSTPVGTPLTRTNTKMIWSTSMDSEAASASAPQTSGLRKSLLLWRSRLREPAAEFLGTMILVMFGLGVNCQATLSSNSNIASSPSGSFVTGIIGWATGVALGVWVSIDISGGHINPAVTLVLALFRGFSWKKVPVYFAAQTLGAFFGSLLIYANYYSAINIFENGARTVPGTASLFATYPVPYISNGSAFFSEFLTTAIFLVGVLAITHQHKDPHPRGLIPFGLFLVFLGLNASMGMQTSYVVNPARDLGPRLMTWIFYGKQVWNFRSQYWLWTPIIGPFTGAIAGALVYDSLIHHKESDELLPTSITAQEKA